MTGKARGKEEEVIFIGNVAMLRSCWGNEQSEAETTNDGKICLKEVKKR